MRRSIATSNLRFFDKPKNRHEKEARKEFMSLFDNKHSLQERLLNALRLAFHVVAIGLLVFNDIFDSTLSEMALNAIEWVSQEANSMEFRF
jgi:hypothetical protein